jgi:tetratricopeptide (TPR) repeat protein
MIKITRRFVYFTILMSVFSCSSNNNNLNKEHTVSDRSGGMEIDSTLNKMNLAYNQDDYKNALIYIHTLIKMDSTNGEYYYKKGYCESGLFNTNESIKAYQISIIHHYRVIDATFSIGVLYSLTNDSIAKSYFEKCLAIDPNYERAKIQLLVISQRNKRDDLHNSKEPKIIF